MNIVDAMDKVVCCITTQLWQKSQAGKCGPPETRALLEDGAWPCLDPEEVLYDASNPRPHIWECHQRGFDHNDSGTSVNGPPVSDRSGRSKVLLIEPPGPLGPHIHTYTNTQIHIYTYGAIYAYRCKYREICTYTHIWRNREKNLGKKHRAIYNIG